VNFVVLDTNIIISAALVNLGKPARIIELISDDKLELVYNDTICYLSFFDFLHSLFALFYL